MSGPVHEKHRGYAPLSVTAAVITVSDTRTLDDDESGAVISEALAGAGHEVTDRVVVPDDVTAIRERVEAGLGSSQVVILNGGTGLGRRDVTVEAVAPLLEKELVGFGEAFRRLSFDAIGTPAVLSRATAGVRDGKVLFLLPGSPAAAELAMDRLILPELGHIVAEASR
jgi:molybdenum cofactor biosynthesis protein B